MLTKTELQKKVNLSIENINLFDSKQIIQNILSEKLIDCRSFYEWLDDKFFEQLEDNGIFRKVLSDDSYTYILTTAYCQYLIVDKLCENNNSIPLAFNYTLELVKYFDSEPQLYITNSSHVILFKLIYSPIDKKLIIDEHEQFPSQVLDSLSDNETIELLALANSQYILYTLLNGVDNDE